VLAPAPAPAAEPSPGPAGTPRYHNYSPPQAVGETAAEPSVGFNPLTRRAMYISGLQTLRVTFPEDIEPKGSVPEAGPARWEDVSFIGTKTRSLDPILFTDQRTGRTFVSQLNSVSVAGALLLPGNSLMAYTDDDGANWTPAQLNLPDGSNDHQTVGAGPYPASVPLGNDLNKGSAVYYCGQMGNVFVATSVALCSRSDNGGLTFNRAVPVYTGLVGVSGPSCSQLIHGHVKVAPDGTVYLPNAQCGGRQAVAVSTDAGTTWTVRTIPGSLPPSGILDPSVAISKDPPGPGAASNTIYVGYTGRPAAASTDNHAYAVMSRDRGVTWSEPVDLGASHGIKNAVFAQAVAGDSARAAVAFLGTTTGGNHQDANFKGTWHGYVAHTYDGGKTWTTVRVTPDPVQREACIWNGGGNNPCRNLLDFNDATMDDRGRVLFAYADGCINECAKGGANTYSAKATIARQSGGRGLLAAFDAPEPALPQRPYLEGRRDDMASHLNWSPPDNGGSEITAYKIYRGTSPGNEVLIGQAAGDATSYNDRGGDPAVANYVYKVAAVNARGAGPASNSVTLSVEPRVEATGACELPGVTAVLDPAGDASNGQAFHDITSVSMAEPEDLPGKVVFTMKVARLETVPPGWRWAVRFGAPQRPPNAVWGPTEDWFVSMVTSDGAAPTFTYGTTGVPQNAARVFTTVGSLDPASKAEADGTITLVLPKSAIGNPQPGQAISGMLGSVRATVPSALPGTGGTNETIPDSTGGGAYTLRAANLCLPNTAPLARLTADADEGTKPLTVRFDAGASSDADAIDTVATYTFNFGDGSDDVVSTSPAITHTFDVVGEYPVRLVVTDSRGKVSANTARYLVEVKPDPACSSNVALASGGATALASSVYPSWDFNPLSAIDGDRTGASWGAGGGWNDGTRGLYPDWLEVSFPAARRVSEVRVYTLQDGHQGGQEPTGLTTAEESGIIDFDVQYWDGGQWLPVPGGEIRSNTRARRSIAFADITTTKIRVLVHNSRLNYSRVVEVEAIGCGN
ncbi:MAG TPA: PKD domain-containing protein, partial [Pyrinomonadaceae bacterium]|nr:PKD domain-containing protein [Pyrinomonadaceae bacterium]